MGGPRGQAGRAWPPRAAVLPSITGSVLLASATGQVFFGAQWPGCQRGADSRFLKRDFLMGSGSPGATGPSAQGVATPARKPNRPPRMRPRSPRVDRDRGSRAAPAGALADLFLLRLCRVPVPRAGRWRSAGQAWGGRRCRLAYVYCEMMAQRVPVTSVPSCRSRKMPGPVFSFRSPYAC